MLRETGSRAAAEGIVGHRLAPEPEDRAIVSGPMAIGFFPPITQKDRGEDDGSLSEAYSHLGFALEDVQNCLAPRRITLVIKITRSLLVMDGANSKPLAGVAVRISRLA